MSSTIGKPDHLRIAVLEHDLLGIQPQPGSVAAAVIGLRAVIPCASHQPVDVTTLGSPGPIAICAHCGTHLVHDPHGEWTAATA